MEEEEDAGGKERTCLDDEELRRVSHTHTHTTSLTWGSGGGEQRRVVVGADHEPHAAVSDFLARV